MGYESILGMLDAALQVAGLIDDKITSNMDADAEPYVSGMMYALITMIDQIHENVRLNIQEERQIEERRETGGRDH